MLDKLSTLMEPDRPYSASRPLHSWGLCLAVLAICFALPDLTMPAALAAPTRQAYLKAFNTSAGAKFGFSVATSGDILVSGSPAQGANAGAAYVFVRNGTNWNQGAYLKASNAEAGDSFGYSVSVSGNTVVVGAPSEDSNSTRVNGNGGNNLALNSGAAYVFVRSGTNWSQEAYLKASNTGAGDLFGWSVAVSGDTVVIGAQGETSNATGVNGNQAGNSETYAGAAYVFVRSGTNWSQQAYLKASNTGAGDRFGWSLAVAGDTVLVGAPYEASNTTGVNGNQSDNSTAASGAAYAFVRSGTNWNQQAYLKASNTGNSDRFGSSLAVSGDTVVVGAFGESSNATGVNGNQINNSAGGSGAVYVFVRSETTWSQQAYLKASNTETDDLFGYSVALSGDTLVVGAVGEDSYDTRVNGDESDNSYSESGAAYVFVRSATNWIQESYIKASNTGAGDDFGCSVGISGDTVAVGADYESSSATGVNGNQTDNSAQLAGAAYVLVGDFTSSCAIPQLSIIPAGYFIRFNSTPGCTYQLQRSTNVTGPWSTLATLIADSNLLEYHDATPPHGQSFYQVVLR